MRLASKSGVLALAITDHDTMDGVEEALLAGVRFGVEVVPGVELSVLHNGLVLHILGYYQDSGQADLARAFVRLQTARDERNNKIISKLQALGIDATTEELSEISGIGQTGRPHIARLLMAHGAVSSLSQAFDMYLAKGKKAYVGRFTFSAKEAISLIKQAGGLAVLAHPIQIDKTLSSLEALLPELTSYGLDGIETYYPSQKKKEQKRIRKFAAINGLFLTGGSDYHGDIRPGTRLAGGHNIYVPPKILEEMKRRL